VPRIFKLILLLALAAPPASAHEPFGPFKTKAAPVTKDARVELRLKEKLPNGDFLGFAFQVYQATLSSQDGPRCFHSPTCSGFGVQAVRRHKLLGFGLTVDRLWRAGRSSDLRPLPRIAGTESDRLYDPLDANDFWLRGIADHDAPEYAPPRPRQ
jgi:hypothetical protein